MIAGQRIAFDDAHILRQVELEIEVPPGFPGKYLQALVRAAEGCTVKKAIEAQPRFAVRTVISGERELLSRRPPSSR